MHFVTYYNRKMKRDRTFYHKRISIFDDERILSKQIHTSSSVDVLQKKNGNLGL